MQSKQKQQQQHTLMKLNAITAIAFLLLSTAGIARAQDGRPAKKATTPEALQTEIEGLRPAKLAWREIQWKTCLLEGLKESREKKKPILLWVIGPGEALEGRC